VLGLLLYQYKLCSSL